MDDDNTSPEDEPLEVVHPETVPTRDEADHGLARSVTDEALDETMPAARAATEPGAAAPTWGWSAPAPPGPTRPGRGDDSQRARSPARTGLAGALVGALVGAAVAGGLVVAFDDDGATTTTIVRGPNGESARPATALEEPGDIRSILDAVQPAVVRIDVEAGAFGQGTGTGFIIESDGVIVTNAHVVAGGDTVTVTLSDGDQVEGEVVGRASAFDLAVIKIDRDNLPTATLGDSDELQVGDAVVAIGNALGLSDGSGATVTTGIVSGLDRLVGIEDELTLVNAIQTDAAINPGNSGGPLVDTRGRVVGINSAIASPESANNVGFAIAISDAKPVIEQLREGRTARIAFLGVLSEPVTPAEVRERGLTVERGAIVVEVEPETAAQEAGLQPDDVLLEVAGTEVARPEDVARAVRRHQPGDEIAVTFLRDGERRTIDVVLGERPENP